MSLINDALKRAKQAQQKQPPPATAGAPLRAVEAPRPARASRSLLLPVLLAALLMLVAVLVAVFVLVIGRGSGRNQMAKPVSPQTTPTSTQPAAAKPTVVALPPKPTTETPAVAAAKVAAPPPKPVVTNPVVPVAETPPAQTVAKVEPPKPPAVVNVPPPPPLPKLQGILFNPARPTALFNGKSVIVGGRIGEYTVVSITRQAVAVERAGRTNLLTMEE